MSKRFWLVLEFLAIVGGLVSVVTGHKDSAAILLICGVYANNNARFGEP